MSNFREIAFEFGKMSKQMNNNVSGALYEESQSILADLKARSPVDSGLYRSNWRVQVSRFQSYGTIFTVSIINETPYGIYIEEGAEKFKYPWYYPNRDKQTGRFRKGTGKLKESKGRVWPGGLNPGHSMTVGGAIGPALINSQKRLAKLSEKIAKAVISGF